MESTYKIVWSADAIKNLQRIIDYLSERWTAREINNFAAKLDKHLNLIARNPYLFPETARITGVRRSVLSKQTTIYYKIDLEDIKIITLFDNRQNPNKLSEK